ncbi:MAG: hypothetical protein E6167_00970 [Varibaculum cambriense]|nr:hypothetical protein [Varibaculum cambriense]
MLRITVFMNGATRRYQTESFKSKYGDRSDMEVYDEVISNINHGYTKVITFKDVFSNVNVSVSPITCLIEYEEVIEDKNGTKKA